MTCFARFETVLGTVLATELGGALTSVNFIDAQYCPEVPADWREDSQSQVLRACARQLHEYFEGERGRFELPLAPRGTPFQQRVWREIAAVGCGQTLTYAQLADRAGAPGAVRAAGAATGRNPIAVIVPCHRILGAGGRLTGYAGGIWRKQKLLELEGVLQGLAA